MDSVAPAPVSSSPNVNHGDIADHSQIHGSVGQGNNDRFVIPFFYFNLHNLIIPELRSS